ncbi:hypothetical protein [Mycolicibacterium sp. P9-64]|nr:hypothetical protein [Mycolicibacterium sp. P9-64]
MAEFVLRLVVQSFRSSEVLVTRMIVGPVGMVVMGRLSFTAD